MKFLTTSRKNIRNKTNNNGNAEKNCSALQEGCKFQSRNFGNIVKHLDRICINMNKTFYVLNVSKWVMKIAIFAL